MVDKILREESRQEQKSAEKAVEQDTDDLTKRQGKTQVEYMRSLGKPAERARAAFRAAGVPLDKLLPEDVVSFEHKADGSFVLKLARELKIHIGTQALLLGTTISGILGNHEIRHLMGIATERTHGSAVNTARGSRMTFFQGELVLETEGAGSKPVRMNAAALDDAQ